MNFIQPDFNNYTIYSKSGCYYCTKVKELLQNENPTPIIINCDEYLFDDKEGFLQFIEKISGVSYRTFPMVFHKCKFIGGYNETKKYYEESNINFNENTMKF